MRVLVLMWLVALAVAASRGCGLYNQSGGFVEFSTDKITQAAE